MKQKTLYIIIILILLIMATWMITRNNINTAMQPEVLLENVAYDVRLFKNVDEPSVGDTIDFRLEIRKDGQFIDLEKDYILTHATVVSHNVADIEFYHATENLLQTSRGVYEFTHTFNEETDYTIWIEMNDNTTRDHHSKQSDYVGKIHFPLENSQETTDFKESKEFVFNSYRVRLTYNTLKPNNEEQLKITVETLDGEPVPVLEDFDHYYVIAAPRKSFYLLEHPDLELSSDTEIITTPTNFPASGHYALWMRIFIADENGDYLDAINGVFTVKVE